MRAYNRAGAVAEVRVGVGLMGAGKDHDNGR